MVADSSHCPVSALILLNGPLFYDGSPTRQREIKRYQQKQETKTQDFDAMNKTSLLMLLVGTILGIAIGYITFSTGETTTNLEAGETTTKPEAAEASPKPEYFIEAEGFRNVSFNPSKKQFNIDITRRIDANNVEIVKNIQLPISGFVSGKNAMKDLLDDLVSKGILKPDNSPQE